MSSSSSKNKKRRANPAKGKKFSHPSQTYEMGRVTSTIQSKTTKLLLEQHLKPIEGAILDTTQTQQEKHQQSVDDKNQSYHEKINVQSEISNGEPIEQASSIQENMALLAQHLKPIEALHQTDERQHHVESQEEHLQECVVIPHHETQDTEQYNTNIHNDEKRPDLRIIICIERIDEASEEPQEHQIKQIIRPANHQEIIVENNDNKNDNYLNLVNSLSNTQTHSIFPLFYKINQTLNPVELYFSGKMICNIKLSIDVKEQQQTLSVSSSGTKTLVCFMPLEQSSNAVELLYAGRVIQPVKIDLTQDDTHDEYIEQERHDTVQIMESIDEEQQRMQWAIQRDQRFLTWAYFGFFCALLTGVMALPTYFLMCKMSKFADVEVWAKTHCTWILQNHSIFLLLVFFAGLWFIPLFFVAWDSAMWVKSMTVIGVTFLCIAWLFLLNAFVKGIGQYIFKKSVV